MSEQTRDKVFISYSHNDKEWLQKLQTMLKPLVSKGNILPWDDSKIRTGKKWDDEIKKALETTRIAVLLVSDSFLASDYIANVELPALLAAAEKGECTLCWVLIHECLYEETGLKEFQAAHDIKQPLAGLSAADEKKILAEIARKINRIYREEMPPLPAVKGKQIKILSITASPDDVDDIFYEQEQDTLLNAFQSFDRDDVYFDMPDPVKSTLDEIKERLEDGKHDILHITAHGGMNDKGEGVLSFEDHQGKKEKVTGSQLAEILKGLTPAPIIVILSSCHSARRDPDLMPVARALFDAGIAAVIGMNKAVSHAATVEFNAAFFTALRGKKNIKEAFEEGKEAIFQGEQRRIKENPNWNALKEYEIPQLLARDENLGVESFSDYRIEAPGRPQSHHFQGARYLERGFIGRRQVLREIFKAIANKQGAGVLKGPGGIGKSTLTTRIAANLLRDGYEFIIIRGDASEVKILEAISNKAEELGVAGAKEVYAANAEPIQKLSWFVENFLGPRRVMIIFDNFEENQDEGRGDFGGGKETLKEFLWCFKDFLKNKESFLFFSTRYALPGFEGPDVTKNIPEFTVVEFRKMLLNGKALKRLDGKSIETLQHEIGGNPRALELLDRIAYNEFNQRDYSWEELKDLMPELRRRIIEKKGEGDDFAPLFLDKLFHYLAPGQRLIIEVLSIYRNPVPKEAVEVQGAEMARVDRKRLADLSLLECMEMEKGQLYYVHRLTAQYILDPMGMVVKNKYHLQAGQYFEGIRNEKGEKYIDLYIESRWHYIQAGNWDRAAEITCYISAYLRNHGYAKLSLSLLLELEMKEMKKNLKTFFYYELGIAFMNLNLFALARSYFKHSLSMSENLENGYAAINLYGIGNTYFSQGRFDNSMRNYKQAIEKADGIGDRKIIYKCLHGIGNIFYKKGDLEKALNFYLDSLKICKEIGDKEGIPTILHGIGMIKRDKGCYEEALRQFDENAKEFEIIGDQEALGCTLHEMGIIFQDQENYEESLHKYTQALNVFEKIEDTFNSANSMAQIGQVYISLNKFEAALKFLLQSFSIFSKIGSPNSDIARDNIPLCREKMPEERFRAILKENGMMNDE